MNELRLRHSRIQQHRQEREVCAEEQAEQATKNSIEYEIHHCIRRSTTSLADTKVCQHRSLVLQTRPDNWCAITRAANYSCELLACKAVGRSVPMSTTP